MRVNGGAVGIAIFNAIFTDEMAHLGDNIAAAVIPAGLPPSSVGDFITNLAGQNNTGLALVPGVSPPIIGAGVGALLDDAALVEDVDDVGALDGGEAVGDGDSGAALGGLVEGRLHDVLGLRVQRAGRLVQTPSFATAPRWQWQALPCQS